MKNKFHIWIIGALIPVCTEAQPGLFVGDKAAVCAPVRPHEISITMTARPYVSIDLLGSDDHTTLNPEIDVAYSPTRHVSISGSYRSLIEGTLPNNRGESNYYEPADKLKGYRFELGMFYHYPLSEEGFITGGLGYLHGTLTNNAETPYYVYDQLAGSREISRDFSGRYNGGFLQATAGMQTRHVRLAGGLKYSLMQYQSFDYADPSYNEVLPGNYHEQAIEHKLNGYIQPYFDFAVGGRFVKFNFQTGFLVYTDDTIDKRLYLSLGLTVLFGAAR